MQCAEQPVYPTNTFPEYAKPKICFFVFVSHRTNNFQCCHECDGWAGVGDVVFSRGWERCLWWSFCTSFSHSDHRLRADYCVILCGRLGLEIGCWVLLQLFSDLTFCSVLKPAEFHLDKIYVLYKDHHSNLFFSSLKEQKGFLLFYLTFSVSLYTMFWFLLVVLYMK